MAKVATKPKNDVQDQINAIRDDNAALAAQVGELATLIREVAQPRNVPPVSRSGVIDSGDLDVGGSGVVRVPSDGIARIENPDIVIPDGPPSKAKAEELAFMEELVEVTVAPTSDKNERQLVSTWNDGRHQLFIRGMPVVCKRKFLEVLARSKPAAFESIERVDQRGVRQIDYPRNVAQKYPLQVNDKNPRGADWLRKVYAEQD